MVFVGIKWEPWTCPFFFQAAEEAKKREKELAEAEKSAGKMGDILEFLTVFEDLYNS